MSDTSKPHEPYSLQEGLKLFAHGDYVQALPHLTFFTNLKPVTSEVIIAMHHSGIAMRHMHELHGSLRHLSDALREAQLRPGLAVNIADIKKDLALTMELEKQYNR